MKNLSKRATIATLLCALFMIVLTGVWVVAEGSINEDSSISEGSSISESSGKVGHAVVAYKYVDSTYTVHYGWDGYPEITIVNFTLGSIYAMEVKSTYK